MSSKKIGTWVEPAAGFNVIATANTKGKGSDDGRFIGTNVLNEAFLERFPVTFEQEYPTPATEIKILLRVAASLGSMMRPSVSVLWIGQTSSVRHSLTVVWMNLSQLVAWFTFSVHTLSLMTRQKQFKFA